MGAATPDSTPAQGKRTRGCLFLGAAIALAAAGCADSCSPTPCASDLDCPESGICVEGWCDDGAGVRHDIAVAGARLIYRNDTGRLDVYGEGGRWIVRGGTALAWTDSLDEIASVFRIDEMAERTARSAEEDGALGRAQQVVVAARGGARHPALTWRISGYPERGCFTFQLEVENPTDEVLPVAKLAPIVVDGDGGLYLGDHPATHRILENGSYTVMDHYARLVPGDVARNEALAALVPGRFEGHSASNWSHAVQDLASDSAWVAGSLTFEAASPVVNLSFDEDRSAVSPDGRRGFTYFSVEAAYQPALKPLAPGERFGSERAYVHPTERDALAGLERYADAVKQQLGIVLWTERAPGNRVPNGWNSWSGSGGTGGYGTDIDEALIIENLDFMAAELRDWGVDWFQIDDGYEPAYGDWTWRTDRFPSGPRWLSDQIRARGFKPGLWIAPFTPAPDSQLVAEHPAWMAERSVLGDLLVGGYELLDLTHPEVQAWLRELFHTFRHDWGFDWLKMDFSYWALFGDAFHDPTQTREQAYRAALRLIREEIGEETFFLAVSGLGPHMGLVDSDRLTMDTMPVWDWEPGVGDDEPLNQQGFKPTVRTTARRYFLHGRVWINHPDLIIFRSNTLDVSWPRVTLAEAQALCTFVGMTGGIVKMGDRLLDLTAEQINSLRRFLPVYGEAARPLDLFTREFPELWHLPIEEGAGNDGERYDLLGLFHWGRNWDHSHNPAQEMADDGSARAFAVSVAELGLSPGVDRVAYEFWTGSLVGNVDQTLQVEVPSHSARVIALRRRLDHPQLLGWNRHFTMGATEILSSSWSEADASLTLRARVAAPSARAPFTYELAFLARAPYAYQAHSLAGVATRDQEVVVEGDLLRLRFVPEATGEVTLTIAFGR